MSKDFRYSKTNPFRVVEKKHARINTPGERRGLKLRKKKQNKNRLMITGLDNGRKNYKQKYENEKKTRIYLIIALLIIAFGLFIITLRLERVTEEKENLCYLNPCK